MDDVKTSERSDKEHNFKCKLCSTFVRFETKDLLRKHLRIVHRRVNDMSDETKTFKRKEMKGALRPKNDPEMLQVEVNPVLPTGDDGDHQVHFCPLKVCHESFESHELLAKHLRVVHHRVGLQQPKLSLPYAYSMNTKKFHCTICPRTFFKSKPEVEKHVLESHITPMPVLDLPLPDFLKEENQKRIKYRCDKCDAGFKSTLGLKSHQSGVHKDTKS